jgi:tetratricopeptide (TPR) repeat protein
LKGFSQAVELYEVVSESLIDSHFQAATTTTTLVGRSHELRVIEEVWRKAQAGVRALVLVGEPGIGKSALAAHAQRHIAGKDAAHIVLQCSPHHKSSPLYPVVRRWQRDLGGRPADDSTFERLRAVAGTFRFVDPDSLFALASLLSIPWPVRVPPPTPTAQQLRDRTFAILVSWVDKLAARRPLILVVEDLHWADPSTRALLVRIVDSASTAPAMVLMSSRELPGSLGSRCEFLEVGPLNDVDSEKIVDDASGSVRLPAGTRRLIIERSDGVPLYVQELTRMLSDPRRQSRAAGAVDVFVPPTLHDLLVARLDSFPDERDLVLTIATIGQPVSSELLQRLLNIEEQELARQLRVLVDAQLLKVVPHEPPAYEFGHTLMRDAAYGLQLRKKRRERHARVASVLVTHFSVTGEERPEVLAYHSEQAGDSVAAARHWLRAARRYAAVAAHAEAIEHFQRALTVAAQGAWPDRNFEHEARSGLAASLLVIRGYTSEEVAEVYRQLRSLSAEWKGRLPTMYGPWAYYHVRGQNKISLELAERLVLAASTSDTPNDALAAAAVLGYQHLWLGHPVLASRLLESGSRWDAPGGASPFPHHPGIGATVNRALALWLLGQPSAARATALAAVSAAEAMTGSVADFTRAYTHTFAAGMFHAANDPVAAREHAKRAIEISSEQRFASWLGAGLINLAVADALTEDPVAHIPAIQFGLAAWREAGAEAGRTQFLLGLAKAYRRAGQFETALTTVEDALDQVEATEERFLEADLLRLRGELLVESQPRDLDAALAALDAAVAVARGQQARALEIQALTSRHTLRQSLGLNPGVEDLRRLLESFQEDEGVDDLYLVAARGAAGKGQVAP